MPITPLSRARRVTPRDPPVTAIEDPQSPPALSPALRALLLAEAAKAVAGAAARQAIALPDPAAAPEALRGHGNSFVTAMMDGRLRGCVGSLKPTRALVVDVADNAHRAVTGDPRFPPITPAELPGLALTVAVLGPAQPLTAADEDALIAQLAPGRDGVILGEGDRRALFLPKVWEMVPEPKAFLGHLKAKAGLPPDYWSPRLRAWRFVVESFDDAD